MTDHLASSALTDTVAQAVLDTPGVAFLRPGLVELLRAANPLAKRSGASTAAERPARSTAVRLTRDPGSGRRHADVHVVLHRGHRAVDVTREVRAAVAQTLHKATGDEETVTVSVTVTGRV
ncbi:Asp23/Gls24 family envelope stress response protein [Streptomyces arenae]|nr:Asp23/Gls24 family envelope stress response protein [Streptomyces arenae]